MLSFDAIQCPIKLDDRYTVNLVGDKGFIGEILHSVRINMVLPFKINSRVGYVNETMKLKLKKRRKIEHVFCRMDKFKRIFNRMERKASHFKSFNYFAAAIMTLEGIKRLTIDQSLQRTALKAHYVPRRLS